MPFPSINIASVSPTESWTGENRRARTERRHYSLVSLRMALVSPRRFRGRRQSDRRFALLDRFEASLAILATLLVLLSILDSILTLHLLARGGTELNPIMNRLLAQSVEAFMVGKMLLTAIPAVLLVATGNIPLFGRIRARSFLAALVGLYVGLILYEVALITLS